MKTTSTCRRIALAALAAASILTAAVPATAQPATLPQPAARLHEPLDFSRMVALRGSLHPLAIPANDAGRLPGDTPMLHMMLYFSPTPQQQSDLKQLLAAQQTPGSPQFHQIG